MRKFQLDEFEDKTIVPDSVKGLLTIQKKHRCVFTFIEIVSNAFRDTKKLVGCTMTLSKTALEVV